MKDPDFVALAPTTFLLIKVVTADDALRVQLGSATVVLWTVFYAMAVISSFFGAIVLIRARSPCSTLAIRDSGLYIKVLVFLDLRKRRAAEFEAELADTYCRYEFRSR